MSKNKHGDLFNTSLTEIIIILFFVLMLFALYNIDKVNKENVELGSEVDVLSNDIDILIDRNKTIKDIIAASSEPSSLGPINIELSQQIVDLKKENKELEREIAKLSPEVNSDPETSEPISDLDNESLIAGNCIDKTFWRQCAEWAWPIEIERTPPVDFLFDIGMCSAGDIVVIKSDWERKQEMDFILVDGASIITDKLYIERNEIIEFMSLIHDKSLDFKEGQTQHVARLINLELIDTDVSKFPRKAIGDEMNFIPTTRFEKKYEEILDRFPKNACSYFQEITNNEPDINIPLESIDGLYKPGFRPSSESIDNLNLSDSIDNTQSSKASFAWDGKLMCDKASGRTNSKFIIQLNLEITSNKRVKVKSYEFEKTNRNNRLVALDLKKSIIQQRKNIVPAKINGENVNSTIQQEYTIPANICR